VFNLKFETNDRYGPLGPIYMFSLTVNRLVKHYNLWRFLRMLQIAEESQLETVRFLWLQ
jgi:hypothetical protein